MTTKNNLKSYASTCLLNHQQKAVDFIVHNTHVILPLKMGYGKTLITLVALAEIQLKTRTRTLVFAPLRVAQTVWLQEAIKWKIGLDIQLAIGSAKKRSEVIESDADVVVINYDNMPWFFKTYTTKHNFNNIVFDELSKLKTHNSKRFKVLKRYLKTFSRAIGLTGTFTSQGLQDIFSQTYCINQEVFGRSFHKWREWYFEPVDFHKYKWLPKPGALDQITEKIKPFIFHMSDADYLSELPDIVYNKVYIDLPKDVRTQYAEMKRDLIIRLRANVILASSMAVVTIKLQQIVQGFIYTEDKEGLWLHDEKKKALLDIISEAQGAPIAVAYKFIEEANWLRNEFGAECLTGVQTDKARDIIERWNNGQIPLLAIHPRSAGHGLNLQHGGDTLVWLGIPYSLDDYQQTIARFYRRGQKNVVWVHHILASGTIDDTITTALLGKEDTQTAVMEALRADI